MRRSPIAVGLLSAVLVAAVIVLLWPREHEETDEIVAGTVDEVQSSGVLYLEEHGVFVVAFDGDFLALSDDARHVGDRVLYCAMDGTFSSPAHGERFDRHGRYVAGPAAGDMGRYPLAVERGRVIVDLSGKVDLPHRSSGSDSPTPPFCEGGEGPAGFYEDAAR